MKTCPVCESPLDTGDHEFCELLRRGNQDLQDIKRARVEYVVRVVKLEKEIRERKAGNDAT